MAVAVIKPTRFNRCGFCSTNHHETCCIAVEGQRNDEFPEGRVWPCTCEEGPCKDRSRIKCFTCNNRNTEEIDPETWRCIDVEACQAEMQRKREANPLYAQLQEIKEKTDMATATKKAVKKAAAPKEGKCLCCGGVTKGGDFLPGHDARFVSQRVAAVMDGKQSKVDARKACGDVSANLGAKFDKSLGLAQERATKKAQAAKDKAAAKKAAAKAPAKKVAAKA